MKPIIDPTVLYLYLYTPLMHSEIVQNFKSPVII